MLKGEGSTPVIMSPKEPVIDWTRYEAVEIRMRADGGKEIKIKIGNEEFKQKLGPLRQYNDYRFEVRIGPPGVRPLAIMPTDGLLDLVAIKSIRLAPRKADFTQAAARNQIPTETLVRLRQYERLSWVLGTAIGHAIDFMDRAKEGGNIPELIEAMSNSVQALRLVTERLRIAEGNATKDEVVDEANAHQLKATRILGSGGSGPIGDRIAKANLEATKAIRLLDREK